MARIQTARLSAWEACALLIGPLPPVCQLRLTNCLICGEGPLTEASHGVWPPVYIKDSPRIYSRGEEQPYIKSGENTLSMEQEVESLMPASNGYLYVDVDGERIRKWKRKQKAKMMAIKCCRFHF